LRRELGGLGGLVLGGVVLEAGCLGIWALSPWLTAGYNPDFTLQFFARLPWPRGLAYDAAGYATGPGLSDLGGLSDARTMVVALELGLGAMTLGYVLGLLALSRAFSKSVETDHVPIAVAERLVVVFGVLFRVTFLLLPGLFSTDVFSYVMYGRIAAVYGQNPYVSSPADFPNDPFLSWVFAFWRDQPSVYGPAWTDFGWMLSALTHGLSAFDQVLAYRLSLAAFELLALGVLWWLLGRTQPDGQRHEDSANQTSGRRLEDPANQASGQRHEDPANLASEQRHEDPANLASEQQYEDPANQASGRVLLLGERPTMVLQQPARVQAQPARGFRQRRLVAFVLFAWNPLVLFDLVGNSHNDVAMLCLLLLGLVPIVSEARGTRTNWLPGIAWLTLSALVKFLTGVAVVLWTTAWVGQAISRRQRLVRLASCIGLVLAFTFALSWPWLRTSATFAPLGDAAGGKLVLNSAPDLVALTVADQILQPAGLDTETAQTTARFWTRAISRAAFLVYLAWEAWRVWLAASRGDRQPVPVALEATTRALLVLPLLVLTWVWSWYLSCALALAALLDHRSELRWVVVAYTLVAPPIVYAHQYLNQELSGGYVLAFALGPPAGLVIWRWLAATVRHRQPTPDLVSSRAD
jgi:hypothetical protein